MLKLAAWSIIEIPIAGHIISYPKLAQQQQPPHFIGLAMPFFMIIPYPTVCSEHTVYGE